MVSRPNCTQAFTNSSAPIGIEPSCYYNRVVPSRKIMVVGGAGYIGSHTVRLLLEQGYDVSVVDDLSKGFKHNVPSERLNVMNICETDALTELMRQTHPEAVIHFAAFIAVGESMRDPGKYFANNFGGSLSLLNAMDPAGGLGEEHEPETHLIPLLLRAVITGRPVTIFGTDYPTHDGTCIRDYIHVADLAQAHILAVEYLLNG